MTKAIYYFDGNKFSPELHEIITFRKNGKTLKWIANKIGKSQERVRQVEQIAFRLILDLYKFDLIKTKEFFVTNYGLNYWNIRFDKSAKYLELWQRIYEYDKNN